MGRNRHRTWFLAGTAPCSTRRRSWRRHRRFPLAITTVHTVFTVHIASTVVRFSFDRNTRSSLQRTDKLLQKEDQDRDKVEPSQSLASKDVVDQFQKNFRTNLPLREVEIDLHLDRPLLTIVLRWDVEWRIRVSPVRMQPDVAPVRQSIDPCSPVMNSF